MKKNEIEAADEALGIAARLISGERISDPKNCELLLGLVAKTIPGCEIEESGSVVWKVPSPTAIPRDATRSEIGELVRRSRFTRGLSLGDLERLSGVKKGGIHAVESGRSGLSGAKARMLADAIGLPPDDLARAFARLKKAGFRPTFRSASDSRLANLRIAAGLSQAALGEATGIDHSMISRMELGKRKIPKKHLRKLAEFFGVDASEIF